MRRAVIFTFCMVVSLVAQEVEVNEELPLADECNEDLCKLPDCRCSSTTIPGGLSARDTPQFVTVTFDDSLNIWNIDTYRDILYGRSNSNGCPSGATFFVMHQENNYQLANELYNQGFEIALHSMSHHSHPTPQKYWQEATYEDMVKEFADQRTQMAHFANIPIDEIKGIRTPFLQLSGNNSFLMITNHGLVYDSTWPTNSFADPPLWPYTLDYASTQDCPNGPCPSASLPGVWVQPLVSWRDLSGSPCTMVDACVDTPDRYDQNAFYEFILTNFERHYKSNRAPFGFYIHEWYLVTFPSIERALIRFLNLVSKMEDAFVVNANEVVDWVKDPIPVNEYKNKPCRKFTPTSCQATSCSIVGEHNQVTYEMENCHNVCPRVYPWLGNPLGQ